MQKLLDNYKGQLTKGDVQCNISRQHLQKQWIIFLNETIRIKEWTENKRIVFMGEKDLRKWEAE